VSTVTRRYRIRCGDALHVVEMDDDGHLEFHAHPGAFREMDIARATAALSGETVTEGEGCLRIALLVRRGSLSTAVEGGDDARKLLAALRGIRIARKLRREPAVGRGR
jgi:hypothetical protein